ncbi:hypothetical protein KH5H1_19010 [Corallococcus caeni]|nr:hypothetical protein KH5H1_19010 [Corallococcus sp. KH5-1]
MDGAGGKGGGTKDRTRSPATVVSTNRPILEGADEASVMPPAFEWGLFKSNGFGLNSVRPKEDRL